MNKLLIFYGLSLIGLIDIYFFKLQLSSILTFGLLLLCPLMHLFMMKGMHRYGSGKKD
ncbi:DUF2933 domain-containing protein [Patescibacteria group bacterium]|nr:DUF2933 domain-containing protein [Patescibacteria group bacterium]